LVCYILCLSAYSMSFKVDWENMKYEIVKINVYLKKNNKEIKFDGMT